MLDIMIYLIRIVNDAEVLLLKSRILVTALKVFFRKVLNYFKRHSELLCNFGFLLIECFNHIFFTDLGKKCCSMCKLAATKSH